MTGSAPKLSEGGSTHGETVVAKIVDVSVSGHGVAALRPAGPTPVERADRAHVAALVSVELIWTVAPESLVNVITVFVPLVTFALLK
jgi:hypothetical protein